MMIWPQDNTFESVRTKNSVVQTLNNETSWCRQNKNKSDDVKCSVKTENVGLELLDVVA